MQYIMWGRGLQIFGVVKNTKNDKLSRFGGVEGASEET